MQASSAEAVSVTAGPASNTIVDELAEVNDNIRKVEKAVLDIDDKATQLKEDKPEDWRQEVVELRNEKQQLRKKEEQLRNEKEQLREAQLIVLRYQGQS